MTAPGPSIVKGDAATKLAKDTNLFLASVRDKNPKQYGFFAAVPPLENTVAAIEEIKYALDVLKADGVTLFTRYGTGHQYLGDAAFKPVWEVLNEKHAVVFIHPTHPVDTVFVNKALPQPVIDYPHETARAAADLIVSDTLRTNPQCKIILSHAGGTLPYLVKRLAYGLEFLGVCKKSSTQVLEEVASFYFDLALSSTQEVIDYLLKFTTSDHILFGSDYPYAPPPAITELVRELDEATIDRTIVQGINRQNALQLFPRFKA